MPSERAQRLWEYLEGQAGPDGEVRVLWSRAAQELGVSLATVKRARAELLAAGRLVRLRVGGGRGQPSVYRLNRFPPEPVQATAAASPREASPAKASPSGKEREPVQGEPVPPDGPYPRKPGPEPKERLAQEPQRFVQELAARLAGAPAEPVQPPSDRVPRPGPREEIVPSREVPHFLPRADLVTRERLPRGVVVYRLYHYATGEIQEVRLG